MAKMVGATVFGRYYAAESAVHSMDPRAKLVITLVYMVAAVLARDLLGVGVLAIFTIVAIRFSNIPIREVFESIKPLLFILVFTILLNIFATRTGTIYWEWGTLAISSGGLWNALIFTLRIALMLFGASLLTLTTTTLELTDGMEALMKPLAKIGFPAHELAMMTSIALRFIPTFMDEGIKIKRAQESRGAAFGEGGLIKRIKLLVPLLSPLFASAFRHAEELSMAMESRCYHGAEGRTQVRELAMARRDYVAFVATAIMVMALAAIRIWL